MHISYFYFLHKINDLGVATKVVKEGHIISSIISIFYINDLFKKGVGLGF